MFKASCVYFIVSKKDNRVKIGTTTNLSNRFNALNSASSSDLELIYFFPGAAAREKELHEKFKRFRVKGEWFKYTDEIKKFIDALKLVHGTDIPTKEENIKTNKYRNKKINYDKVFTFRMSSVLLNSLNEVAESSDMRVSELVRNMLENVFVKP